MDELYAVEVELNVATLTVKGCCRRVLYHVGWLWKDPETSAIDSGELCCGAVMEQEQRVTTRLTALAARSVEV